MAYPIETKRGKDDKAKANRYLGYKDGGRVKDNEGTNIHISINAQPKPPGPDPALASALAQAATPPMPPPGLPPGGPPPDMGMGPGAPPLGAGAGPGPIAMRRGGRVKNHPSGGETSAATKTRGDKIYPIHKTDTVPARKARGGSASYPQMTNESGGAGGGKGRLHKANI